MSTRSNGRFYPERTAPRGGTPSVGKGYLQVMAQGHPLAMKSGYVLLHRWVLWAETGAEDRPCHWCGITVSWWGTGPSRLHADHVDDDPSNNRPENLVSSCPRCNVWRSRTVDGVHTLRRL